MTTKTKSTDLTALLKRVEGVMELPEGGELHERLRSAIRIGLAKRNKRNRSLILATAIHYITLARTEGGFGERLEELPEKIRDLCEPEQDFVFLIWAAAELEEVMANVAAELDAAEAVSRRSKRAAA